MADAPIYNFDIIDGFDHYRDSGGAGIGMQSTWTAFNWGTGGNQTGLVAGRFGDRAIKLDVYQSYVGAMQRTFPSTTQLNYGFAFQTNVLPIAGAGGKSIHQLIATNGSQQLQFLVNQDGCIIVTSNGVEVYRNLVKKILQATWHFIEYSIKLGDVDGSIQMWIDGEDQGLVSNIDTKGSAATDFGIVYFSAPSFNAGANDYYILVDDFYLRTGTIVRVGECRAKQFLPSADLVSQWTRLTGVTNAAMVDEAQCDGDTTYNSTNVVGNEDSFTLPALDGNPSKIFGVQLTIAAKKNDADTRTVAPTITVAGTKHVLGDLYQTTDYTFGLNILSTNPNTGKAWAPSDFTVANNIAIGYKLTA